MVFGVNDNFHLRSKSVPLVPIDPSGYPVSIVYKKLS